MKQIKLNKPKYLKVKLVAILCLVVLVAGLLFALIRAISSWFDKHEIVFNQVVQVAVQSPITIKERRVEVQQIVNVINQVPNPVDLETDTEKYIYEVFGIENYKLAIAIARAESGLREDAININTNGTVDIGIFQINSIHYKKDGCSLKEVSTMQGNVLCAKQIFDASGFNPWVAFKSGSFISKLD